MLQFFSVLPKDDSDIHRFSSNKWILTMYTNANL